MEFVAKRISTFGMICCEEILNGDTDVSEEQILEFNSLLESAIEQKKDWFVINYETHRKAFDFMTIASNNGELQNGVVNINGDKYLFSYHESGFRSAWYEIIIKAITVFEINYVEEQND
ncbi:hypothetical protein Kuja_0460 [Vibrio phage vB_VchM_Kuja]|uniref:Uncharacterized protein n=1 Tax=Vibrio phage vB_VchM_Kuja TaxID=2686437 RepID=A0A6B9JHP9_9CAUD|nr:hypothetical protein HWC83_gp046 [Vibrio phage vB_VchM_Kuja]QGZ16037.1 hypothetical protein Kuja_0460 [Vibrio phage vB_VchM_Kuja]